MKPLNSFKTETTLEVNGTEYHYHSLPALAKTKGVDLSKLPFSLKILLENALRNEDGKAVKKEDVESILKWDPKAEPDQEIQFTPARALLQDFTGVPAVADMAAMRAAFQRMGGDPKKINPLEPAALVIDHSVQVDVYGTPLAEKENARLEFERNSERYLFLKWGQNAFDGFKVVPPDTGIVHQVNLEYLATVAMTKKRDGKEWVYPDTLVGTDSHTTMINGLGVLGWGVGGIEAEAAMLGQPCTMLIPQVVGFKLTGKLAAGATATDLVLTVTQMLRKKGVVGKFVEFYGSGLQNLTLADRATIANMAPEYGATVGLFPIDKQSVAYLELTNRSDVAKRVEAYYRAQAMWYDGTQPESNYSDTLELDLSKVEPCLAGPARPQDRVVLGKIRNSMRQALAARFEKDLAGQDQAKIKTWIEDSGSDGETIQELAKSQPTDMGILQKSEAVKDPSGETYHLTHGSVVIAAITSCTNTSNPSVLVAAGLLAKKALEKGLKAKPWVKTSLAPGSQVVPTYLKEAGLLNSLEALGFHVVGFGCTTCIGNSGPLPEHLVKAIKNGNLSAAAVISGNRNFEGRVNPHVRANYLASPPLVVAYAIAGNVNLNLTKSPIGHDNHGKPVFLKDIWPTSAEVEAVVNKCVTQAQFKKSYANVFAGSEEWQKIKEPKGELYQWQKDSTYIKEPPFFQDLGKAAVAVTDIKGARVLGLFGDSITTDHISPAGDIEESSPAGQYLKQNGVSKKEFNSYGARRGNHEIMMRGTFANIRLKNKLLNGVEGGFTAYQPSGEQMSIFDASMKYQAAKTPLVIIGGKEYGTGSSRDWAAKGTKLLGVRAVITESFERIHRSNLVGMGVLPLQFKNGESAESLRLTGKETFDIEGLTSLKPGQDLTVKASGPNGVTSFKVRVRVDTPNELEYFKNGGILQYVLRQLA